MRLVKWKTLVQDQHAFEYDEFHLKGTVMIEDDTLSDEAIRSRIEERLLTQEQRDNRVSKISITHVPVI
jgi:hypothetical protein